MFTLCAMNKGEGKRKLCVLKAPALIKAYGRVLAREREGDQGFVFLVYVYLRAYSTQYV